MLKKFLISCSLLLSSALFAETNSLKIEINEDKGVERHSYYFGMVNIHSTRFINYRVTNTGTTPLQFQSASIGGIGYSARHSCTGLINPQSRCQFTIQYSPFFEGYHVGSFRLAFDQGYEILVNLSGQAVR